MDKNQNQKHDDVTPSYSMSICSWNRLH